jgi:hypothetical protein
MRKLELRDVIAATRLITAMDIKEEFKSLAVKLNDFNKKKHSEAELDASRMSFGIDMWWIILSGASKKRIESDLYALISSLIDVPAEDVPKMAPDELISTFKEKVEVKEFANFFKRALQSMMQS